MSLEFFHKSISFVLIALELIFIEANAIEYRFCSEAINTKNPFFNPRVEQFLKNDINFPSFELFSSNHINRKMFSTEDRDDNLATFNKGIEEDTSISPNQTEQNQTNTLEFDFEHEDKQFALLPQNISFMENALWGENGLFRSIGITSPLTAEQRQKELEWRRTLLTLHQTLGLITWGLMAGSVTLGQLWLDGKLESPVWHRRLVYGTIATYSLTGLLAIITPPPFERRDEFSSIFFHKLAAWVHFAGMIATPILGRIINSSNDYYKLARIHQKVAYVTFSVYSIAMFSIILLN